MTDSRTTHPRGSALLVLLLLLVAAGAAAFWFLRSRPVEGPTRDPESSPSVAAGSEATEERPSNPEATTASSPPETSTVRPNPAKRPTLPGDEPRYDENGDRIVIGLDGLELRQPRNATVAFAIFAEGQRNELGAPTGVLPDGSWVYYNIPTTVTQDGRTVETLNRMIAQPVGNPVTDPEGGTGR